MNDESRFDAYLDGVLSEGERKAFAQSIRIDQEILELIDLQVRIDASLQRTFDPPALPRGLIDRLRAAVPLNGARIALPAPAITSTAEIGEAALKGDRQQLPPVVLEKPSILRRPAVLAIVAVAAAIAWAVVGWQYFGLQQGQDEFDPRMPLADIYRLRVESGFQPAWLCDDDRQFYDTFLGRQGQGLLLAELPPDRHMVGLAYCGGLSHLTTAMLARVDSRPVMLFVDRLADDAPQVEPPAGSGLRLFRKQLGPLVIYEVSPFDSPTMLDYLEMTSEPPPPGSKSGGLLRNVPEATRPPSARPGTTPNP